MKPIRIGFCALVAFAVLAHGSVESWARAIVETGGGVLLVFWAFITLGERRPAVVISRLLPPLVVFTFYALVQWAVHLTVSRYTTRIDLQLVVLDLVMLFLFTQLFRTLADFKLLVWFIMIFSFSVAIFGILQQLTFNGRLYWFREMHYGGLPFGPYVNRNHYAGFADLTIPFALVPLILGKVRRERLFVVAIFTVVPIVALLLAASRGGIISFGVQLLVLAVWLAVRRAARLQALIGLGVVALALLMVSWLGARHLLERFSATQASEVTTSKRASMARGTLHIFLDRAVFGTGLGTLQMVYPRYETLYDGKVVNHSHNDYLEALAETGVIGGLVCFWFWLAWARGAYQALRRAPMDFATALQLSGFLGVVGFLAHSFVDFNLHIPANALFFFFSAAISAADLRGFSPASRAEQVPVAALENAD
jgi:O-antigen ligase